MQAKGFLFAGVLAVALVASAQTSIWIRVVSTQQTGIVAFTPEGDVAWTNEFPGSVAWPERSWWGDGFWSRNFGVTNHTTNGATVRVSCGATNVPASVETCTHNLFLIQKAKRDFFNANGYPATSGSDLISAGMPWPIGCPDFGIYTINPLSADPTCSFVGHTI